MNILDLLQQNLQAIPQKQNSIDFYIFNPDNQARLFLYIVTLFTIILSILFNK
jgi:hypothetical protein